MDLKLRIIKRLQPPGTAAQTTQSRGAAGSSDGCTLEEGVELRGQSSGGELVFALLLRADNFSGRRGMRSREKKGTGCRDPCPWCSPAQLPAPGLVGVEEALAEVQGIQHHALQLCPILLATA